MIMSAESTQNYIVRAAQLLAYPDSAFFRLILHVYFHGCARGDRGHDGRDRVHHNPHVYARVSQVWCCANDCSRDHVHAPWIWTMAFVCLH